MKIKDLEKTKENIQYALGQTKRIVVSRGRKQKRCTASGRMKDTEMVIYKTYLGRSIFRSITSHELKSL